MISILKWRVVREELVNLQKEKIENKRPSKLAKPFLPRISFLLPLLPPSLDVPTVSTEDDVALSTRQWEVARPEEKNKGTEWLTEVIKKKYRDVHFTCINSGSGSVSSQVLDANVSSCSGVKAVPWSLSLSCSSRISFNICKIKCIAWVGKTLTEIARKRRRIQGTQGANNSLNFDAQFSSPVPKQTNVY